MAAKTPILIETTGRGAKVFSLEGFAATDYIDWVAAAVDPSVYSLMRVSVSSGTPGADKIRFANRANSMTATLILESAGFCICPDAVNECGFLRFPQKDDTVANVTAGGTVNLTVELIP